MPLDADAQRVLDLIRESGRPPLDTLSPDAARELMRQGTKFFAPDPPEVAAVRDLAVPSGGQHIRVRLYRGAGTAPAAALPVVLFFHGGGWLFGDLDSHDAVCRDLANRARCAVLAVDYRLAPEHKFPAAADDALAACDWLLANAAGLGLDPTRIAVCGDSAGGNLAAVVALARHDRVRFSLQVLVYPTVDLGLGHDSCTRLGEGYTLTLASMRWFRGHYLNDDAEVADWRASPLRAAALGGLPPAVIIAAGLDPLHDEGVAYARRLAAAGVPVHHRDFPGQMHGFLGMGRLVAAAGVAIGEMAEALTRAFAGAPHPVA